MAKIELECKILTKESVNDIINLQKFMTTDNLCLLNDMGYLFKKNYKQIQ